MKKYLPILIAIIVSFQNAWAQNESFKKAEISNRIEIEGDLNFAWTYLSNLGNLQYLVPSTIKKSVLTGNGKGSIVTLTLQNDGIIVEEVVKLDNKKRRIAYVMKSTPLPIKDYVASFSVNEISKERFEVIFTAKFKVQDNHRQTRIDAFNQLQLELLANIKAKTNESR
jgi:hypothetical protein